MKGIIYFDNGATSFPKPKAVIDKVSQCLLCCGNPSRSSHSLSMYSSKVVFECRQRICSFFNYPFPEKAVFTYNTTYALNLAIKGLYKKDGDILISNLEHNSVFRPVYAVTEGDSKNPYTYRVFDALGSDEEIIQSFSRSLSKNICLAVITACSNVTGKILPIKELSEICKKHGIMLIIDFAQLAGVRNIDLSSLYFHCACFACHKSLYGIMGLGLCVFGKDAVPDTIIEGGNGTMSLSPLQTGELPEKLESGTVSVPAIAALESGIKYIQRTGLDYIEKKGSYLNELLTKELKATGKAEIIGDTENKVPTVLFNIKGVGCERAAAIFAENGICTRAGFHCSYLAHKSLGTLKTGGVRVSLSHTNTPSEIAEFISVVKQKF